MSKGTQNVLQGHANIGRVYLYNVNRNINGINVLVISYLVMIPTKNHMPMHRMMIGYLYTTERWYHKKMLSLECDANMNLKQKKRQRVVLL